MTDSPVFTKTYADLPFDLKEAMRYSGYKHAVCEDAGPVEDIYNEIKGCFTYKVCYREFPVEISGETVDFGFTAINSISLCKLLKNSKKCIIFAATLGLGIDRAIARAGVASPAKALIMQGIGAERIETLCDRFQADMESEYGCVTGRFSPGYGDLPLEMQRDIFTVLDCQRKIGLTLNDSLLMTPMKSVTAIFGIGLGRETEKCKGCEKDNCEYRR